MNIGLLFHRDHRKDCRADPGHQDLFPVIDISEVLYITSIKSVEAFICCYPDKAVFIFKHKIGDLGRQSVRLHQLVEPQVNRIADKP